MTPNFITDQIAAFFKHRLQDLHCGAVAYGNESLFIQPESVVDIATLPATIQTCQTYLAPQRDDILIINDPYSGGTTLSSFTLVMCLGDVFRGDKTPLFFCQRIHLKPRVQQAKNIDQEGLRIPPTPLVQGGELNEMFFTAMTSHPDAPQAFKEKLMTAIEETKEKGERLRSYMQSSLWPWSKKEIRTFLTQSYKQIQQHLHEWPMHETNLETSIMGQTKVKLNIGVTEGHLDFDFSGTTASRHWHLTDTATTGACVGAALAALNYNGIINSGTLKAFQVVAPSGSMVHAKSPAPVYAGMTDGAPFVANLVLRQLSQFVPELERAQSASSHCAIDLQFEDGSHFYDTVVPGLPASPDQPGLSGLDLWHRHHREPSVEEIERRYPLLVKSFAYRQNSGGSGRVRGGDGSLKIFEVLKPAQLTWMAFDVNVKPEGTKGGKSAHSAEVFVQKTSGEKQKLEPLGQMDLDKGNVIYIQAAGGGGFGEVEPKP